MPEPFLSKKTMQILNDADFTPGRFSNTAVAIGNFDGVHLGHRHLLGVLTERAREIGGASVVVTFDPHPLRVLNPARCPPMLCDFRQKAEIIEEMGIDALVRVRFDREFAQMPPLGFAREIVGRSLGAREVFVGPDFAFGKGRAGDIALLSAVGAKEGFSVRTVGSFEVDGERVSSTAVRNAVFASDFGRARRLLGRPYELSGRVVHGKSRGRGLGFPTANLLPRQECLPVDGVFAAWLFQGGKRMKAAVNVGSNPTFGAGEKSVEAFLLDFTGDLYGEELSLRFVRQLRGEVAFGSVEALVAQIEKDVAEVREILSRDEGHFG